MRGIQSANPIIQEWSSATTTDNPVLTLMRINISSQDEEPTDKTMERMTGQEPSGLLFFGESNNLEDSLVFTFG